MEESRRETLESSPIHRTTTTLISSNKFWGNMLSKAWLVFCMRCLMPKELDGIYFKTRTLAASWASHIYEASHIRHINTGQKCYKGHKKDEDRAEGLK